MRRAGLCGVVRGRKKHTTIPAEIDQRLRFVGESLGSPVECAVSREALEERRTLPLWLATNPRATCKLADARPSGGTCARRSRGHPRGVTQRDIDESGAEDGRVIFH
jgi:hypothetical protein